MKGGSQTFFYLRDIESQLQRAVADQINKGSAADRHDHESKGYVWLVNSLMPLIGPPMIEELLKHMEGDNWLPYFTPPVVAQLIALGLVGQKGEGAEAQLG